MEREHDTPNVAGQSSPIISFRDVRFTYDGAHYALDGVTLDVREGEFVCILGGNGSGKSTLARHIDALLLPDEGEVRTCGRLTSDEQALLCIRSSAGIVFQNPDDQIVASVIEDDVAFGPENLGVPSEELRCRVSESLAKVGLQGFERHETATLSGGQKQRVAIAGALAMHPRILVLDEASSMLDPRGRRGLMRTCRSLNEDGLTVVMITHFMDEAVQAGRVVVLKDGKVALDGLPQDVLERAAELQELSLDVPFAVQESLELQELGVPVQTQLTVGALADGIRATVGITPGVHAPRAGRDAPETERRSADDAPAVLRFEDVSFTYVPKSDRRRIEKAALKGGRTHDWGNDPVSLWALRDVTFDLREGELLGIAGHTGSGKSTLVQLAAGLLRPSCGSIMPAGPDPSKVGVVFQYPENQLFAETVFDDVAFGPRNLGLPGEEVERRVRESLLLMRLDFDGLKGKSPFSLSGGQQRRVAIAGVLAMEPSMLVFDEPAAGLDPKSHDALMSLVQSLHGEMGKTVVMVSHNMDDLAALCSRMLVLDRGRIVADGPPSRVFSDADVVKKAGLRLPHVLQLAGELGVEFPDTVPTPRQLARVIAESSPASEAPCNERGPLEAKAREKSGFANSASKKLVRACDASSESHATSDAGEDSPEGGAR